MLPITIAVELTSEKESRSIIQQGLFDANVKATGDGHFDAVCVTARDDQSTGIGGVVGGGLTGVGSISPPSGCTPTTGARASRAGCSKMRKLRRPGLAMPRPFWIPSLFRALSCTCAPATKSSGGWITFRPVPSACSCARHSRVMRPNPCRAMRLKGMSARQPLSRALQRRAVPPQRRHRCHCQARSRWPLTPAAWASTARRQTWRSAPS